MMTQKKSIRWQLIKRSPQNNAWSQRYNIIIKWREIDNFQVSLKFRQILEPLNSSRFWLAYAIHCEPFISQENWCHCEARTAPGDSDAHCCLIAVKCRRGVSFHSAILHWVKRRGPPSLSISRRGMHICIWWKGRKCADECEPCLLQKAAFAENALTYIYIGIIYVVFCAESTTAAQELSRSVCMCIKYTKWSHMQTNQNVTKAPHILYKRTVYAFGNFKSSFFTLLREVRCCQRCVKRSDLILELLTEFEHAKYLGNSY
jgi:hypothetical protein